MSKVGNLTLHTPVLNVKASMPLHYLTCDRTQLRTKQNRKIRQSYRNIVHCTQILRSLNY